MGNAILRDQNKLHKKKFVKAKRVQRGHIIVYMEWFKGL